MRNQFGLDPSENYLAYEFLSTGFRYLGAFVCLVSAFFLYSRRDNLYKDRWKSIVILLIAYPAGFFVFKSLKVGVSLLIIKFLQELPINLAVGFWEEGAFRALLFTGLLRYLNIPLAIFVSGFIFSMWHFDVIHDPAEYIYLFLASANFSILYILGASILQLSFVHFAWDQIVFGFNWKRELSLQDITNYELLFIGVLSVIVYFREKSRENVF